MQVFKFNIDLPANILNLLGMYLQNF